MHNAPLVSIGVPVYNGEKSLARTLDCLLGQTYRNIELILSDNASTDATAQICQKYCAQDPRIRYVRQEKNLGLPGNWTFVAEQATGEFFMWAAADDHWEPEFVEVLLNKLLAEPDAILAFWPYRLFNREAQEYEVEPVIEDFGHRYALVRIYKLTKQLLDRSNHALIRRQRAEAIAYKLWLFPKITTVNNVAFPSLYFLAAKGNFVLASLDKPLRRKTMTSKPADYRDYVHLSRPRSFADISSRPEVQARLQALYGAPEAVEFFPGLFCEDRATDSPLPGLILRMVAVDAFSQALTNPLLSPHLFNEATFSRPGWEAVNAPFRLADLVARNTPDGAPLDAVRMTRREWRREG